MNKNLIETYQNNYDQETKVDVDEELINIMKYQSTYEANAKMIQTMDKMIQTLLGIIK